MAAGLGTFMTAFTLAEGAAVFALLGYDYLTHRDRGLEAHETQLSKINAALSQDKLTIQVDPAAASQPWYEAARVILKQPAGEEPAYRLPADLKIPMVVRSSGSAGHTDLHLQMTVKELQDAAMAAQHMMNSEMADILAHAPEISATYGKEARNLAQSIADTVPSSLQLADATAQGRLSENARVLN